MPSHLTNIESGDIALAIAYQKGWDASTKYGRSRNNKLWDADRHYVKNLAKFGEAWADAFETGWMDVAAGNPKGSGLRK